MLSIGHHHIMFLLVISSIDYFLYLNPNLFQFVPIIIVEVYPIISSTQHHYLNFHINTNSQNLLLIFQFFDHIPSFSDQLISFIVLTCGCHFAIFLSTILVEKHH
jgi:hypothetical protein